MAIIQRCKRAKGRLHGGSTYSFWNQYILAIMLYVLLSMDSATVVAAGTIRIEIAAGTIGFEEARKCIWNEVGPAALCNPCNGRRLAGASMHHRFSWRTLKSMHKGILQ